MKNSVLYSSILIILFPVFFAACKKDGNNPVTSPGKVKLEFFNDVGPSSLNMGNQWYKNENGDSFTVSKFNYYISNVVLSGSGTTYTEDSSYHLVQQSDLTTTYFDLHNIPLGTYSTISFMIGVDSTRNISGAQTGALDPINGMFWSWSTGYIMLKFEGNSPKSSQAGGYLEYHCGGYSGANSAIRRVTLPLTQSISVTATNYNHIHVSADVLALFKSPNKIDFSSLPVVNTPGPNAKVMADNYSNMFTITYAGL
jgi:hypothetical protein